MGWGKRTMQQVCHSERSAAKSKNLRIYSYICGEIGAKILRLPSVAQDDTLISSVLLIKADNHKSVLLNAISSRRPGFGLHKPAVGMHFLVIM